MNLSVVICTHNPDERIFTQVLESLKDQSLPYSSWELILIDNASHYSVQKMYDLSWHPNNSVIAENNLGLSHARLTGVKLARSPLIVFVDDDNVLNFTFLEKALTFFKSYPKVGCFGGKSAPVFEIKPPGWFYDTGISLGCQDFGNEFYISEFEKSNFILTEYPKYAPIGTGMVIQKEAFFDYMNEVYKNPERLKLGRKGISLTSGEDNDIILTIIKKGYEIAYLPDLIVKHLIPTQRCSAKYLQKMAFESNKSWVKVLTIHGICPWNTINKWTYSIRKIKNYFYLRAWQSPLSFIKWKSSCGIIKGLSEI